MFKSDIREAYEALKAVVMEDRRTYSSGGWKQTSDDGAHAVDDDSDPIWNKAKVLINLLNVHASEIEGSTDPLYTKAKAFLLDTLDIAGRFSEEWADELIEKERSLLNEVPLLIEQNTEDSVELALAKLWLSLRVAEEFYRRGDYKEATDAVERLWAQIKRHVGESEEMLSLLMTGLTEEAPLSRKIHEIRKEQYHRGGHTGQFSVGGDPRANIWKLCAEDLLALLGRLALTEGKIYIRRARFSDADKSLEQCMRSISAWCARKLSRLDDSDVSNSGRRGSIPEEDDALDAERRRTENFALYGTALAQSYLAFSYYRRGRFRRALTQVIPAGLILRRSHWTFSNIFADLILVGAERRLAGIHNEEHIREAQGLCEKIIELFDPRILQGKSVFSPRGERAKALNPAFFRRACYEIGASYYYLGEIRENYLLELRKNASPEGRKTAKLIKEKMREDFEWASRYAKVIIDCVEKTKPRDAAFWLANARHLDALAIMKKTVSYEGADSIRTEEVFETALGRIESAMESARQDISKWQQTEILTDQAYILNASARYYDERVRLLKEERARIAEERIHAPGRRRPKKEANGHVLTDEERALLGRERELTGLKRVLAEKALLRLNEAWAVASTMAADEIEQSADRRLPEPRPNFAGPIYLYRADSYALLGRKEDATTAYDAWERVRPEVEYIRVIDLSHSVRERVERIDQTLVFNRDGVDGLNYEKQEARLRQWLIEQAMLGAKSKTNAIESVGVAKATFYKWEKEFEESNEHSD